MFSAQARTYPNGQTHIQVKTSDNSRFSGGARRNYGAAFNVNDSDLFQAIGNAEADGRATLPSLAGTSAQYVPVEVRSTLIVAVPATEEFEVESSDVL